MDEPGLGSVRQKCAEGNDPFDKRICERPMRGPTDTLRWGHQPTYADSDYESVWRAANRAGILPMEPLSERRRLHNHTIHVPDQRQSRQEAKARGKKIPCDEELR